MNTSFALHDDYPTVYRIVLDEHNDLESTFKEILEGVTVPKVHEILGTHVTSVIEPTDWKGIWRTTVETNGQSLKCDFEIDVVDVTHHSIEAVVILRKLLSPSVGDLTTEQFDAIDDFMTEQKVRSVKLTDVWVISVGDEQDQRLLQTAIVIEQARWFYKFIWRPWDDLTDSGRDDLFLDRRMDLRVKLYHELMSKSVSESFVKKINLLLKEARALKEKYDKIKSSLCNTSSSESITDSENEVIDEADLLQAMRLEVRIRDIQREVEILEDPYTRVIGVSNVNVDMDEDQDDAEEASFIEGNRIHFVSKVVTLSELQLISQHLIQNQEQETPLLFHRSLPKAVKTAKSGDKICILPGDYVCQSLPWIDFDVEIIGIGKTPSSVVLTACEAVGDLFLNCSSNAIRIKNMTIRTSSETQSVITVHSGLTDLVNCVIDGSKCSNSTVVVLSKADVSLDNCKVIHRHHGRGIDKKVGGNVSVDGEIISDGEDRENDASQESLGDTNDKTPDNVAHVTSRRENKILNTVNCNRRHRRS
jgi:hypothetical protein